MDEGPSNSSKFNEYNTRLQASALNATRKSAALPSDISFHKSLDPGLAIDLDAVSERILSATNKLLSLASGIDKAKGTQNIRKGKLQSQDDVVDSFQSLVVDSMDFLLENTDTCIDTILGTNKAPSIATKARPPELHNVKKPSHDPARQQGRKDPVIQHASHLPKPQLSFKKSPDNTNNPWYPTLKHKYNAQLPLGHIYQDSETGSSTDIVANHPYRHEITHLKYPSGMFTPCTPIPPHSLEETSATLVVDVTQFQAMLSKLRQASEIAVDLEYHNYRSYSGFLCLMQISDREQDWVIDLLTLRDEIEVMNEVFTDPSIVKVFHGAESDIVWLQQDFNIYVVNLFDTFHASKLLEFPRHGLANLLEMYCDFIPDKRYQLADWRIRPLPDDMLRYARSDTHFLLYIYDNLRNALLDKSKSRSGSPTSSSHQNRTNSSDPGTSISTSLLEEALRRSAETSLRVYTKESYDAEEGSGGNGWDTLAKRWNKSSLTAGGPGVGIGAMQREVYKSIHLWRERVAREEDESTRYVLPNHFLFFIAEQPPADITSLLGIFRTSVPPVVKRRAKELLSIIKEAVKHGLPLTKPRMTEGKPVTAPGKQVDEPPTVQLTVPAIVADTVENGKPDIWTTKTNQTPSASRSTLFSSKQTSTHSLIQTTIKFSSSTSSLFDMKQVSRKANMPSTSSKAADFQSIVAKINNSLVMAPTMPQIPVATSPNVSQPGSTSQLVLDQSSGMQIDVEIPYVPASQRPTKSIPSQEEKDTLIVVGQPRQKRKRKTTNTKLASLSKTEEPVEPFDFSTAPNILDAEKLDETTRQDDGPGKKRKKQKRGGGGPFYGDFPAPPKAHNEVKSGNQSFTFSK